MSEVNTIGKNFTTTELIKFAAPPIISQFAMSLLSTLDDGLFLACESRLTHKAVMRSNLSSAVAGGEGLFNLGISGDGILAIESACPREELIEITLDNDVLKVDGNFAIAWSGSLDFTVERSGKTLIGSAASGEGLVNVYRGTGKVLLAPVDKTPLSASFPI